MGHFFKFSSKIWFTGKTIPMRECRNNKITFKEYNMNQLMILMSLEMFIPENHVVRVVSKMMEKIDILPCLKNIK